MPNDDANFRQDTRSHTPVAPQRASRTLVTFLLLALLTACASPRTIEPPRRAGFDRTTFDPGIRAQDDFYGHVNGRWIASTTIPDDRPQVGAFVEATERAEAQLRVLAETLLTDAPTPAAAVLEDEPTEVARLRSYRQQVRDFYRSYMDEKTVNGQGLKPMRALLREIDGIESQAELQRFIGSAQPLYVSTPFALFVGQDARDASRHTLQVSQSGLGLPDRDYYLKPDADMVAIRSAYLTYVRTLLDLAGRREARREAEAVLALETRMAEVSWSRLENRDPLRTYNKLSPAALRALTPGLDWDAVFVAAGMPAGRDLIVRQPTYLRGLSELLREVPLSTWRAYFAFRALDSAAPFLADNIAEAHFRFHGGVLQGMQAQQPRWRRALQTMNFAVGEQLGRLYVDEHFSPEAGTRIRSLVDNVRGAFAASIDGLAWMSEATRAEARQKLAQLGTKIGHTTVWRDYQAQYVRPDDLVGNINRAARFRYNRDLLQLDLPVDRDEWLMTPQTVNAYFAPLLNEIVFTAAILQPPFFDPLADDAVNYGGIGAVIGHEISHAFDNQGRRYDGTGNLRDWWKAEDAARFEALAERLRRQYDGFSPLPGLQLNGQLTLGENIADLSGLAVAWRAWQASLDGREPAIIDGTTGAQRFFIGWAQVWRAKARDEHLRRMVLTNPHSPPRYRVYGVLRNFAPFHEAFGVREGDGMYLPPAERVTIW